MSVQIAASAVQLTFGLEKWNYSHFNQILVYPSEYKNPQTGNMHKGETNLGGFLCFSWKDFVSGNQTPDDKINLGLHEFGHAIRFNGIHKSNDTDYFFDNYFDRWIACAYADYSRLKRGYASLFRKYGGANINEFFSVVVETFFEQPLEFKKAYPKLFIQTSILLNQTYTDEGLLVLNCREKLMKGVQEKLDDSHQFAVDYVLRYNGLNITAMVFAVIGILVFKAGWDSNIYQSSFAYIPFYIAIFFWILMERKYVRLKFSLDNFSVQRGYFFPKKLAETTLPLSHLVSFYFGIEHIEDEGKSVIQIGAASVKYYKNGYFYEETLYCNYSNRLRFDEFCNALRQAGIHVFVKG